MMGSVGFIAVMDPQGQAAIYKYDAVRNILAINRDAETCPRAVLFPISPTAQPLDQRRLTRSSCRTPSLTRGTRNLPGSGTSAAPSSAAPATIPCALPSFTTVM
jgi:hypothetical protein